MMVMTMKTLEATRTTQIQVMVLKDQVETLGARGKLPNGYIVNF